MLSWQDLSMRDWEQFVQHTPWFMGPGDIAVVEDEGPWPGGDLESMPQLSELLGTASLTTLSVSGTHYELIAWGPGDQRRGWLCHPPVLSDPAHVHEIHRRFWSVCGGIIERFAEPDSWWLNQNQVLTTAATRTRVSDVLADYRWIWEDVGLQVPIQPDDYYTVAVEANGNLTLAHRQSGELLLFAPDHAFEDVTPVPGCPPYSLLTIDGVPDLRSWIEECAGAWLTD
jgi:hypothetical protein